MKSYVCVSCGKENLTRDERGINIKLLGEKNDSCYCLVCLADFLGVTEQDILDKIEEFKEDGCILFK